MKIKLLAIGKTDNKNLQLFMDDYIKRLGFYVPFEFEIIPDLKNTKTLSEAQQKQKEGELLLKKTESSDIIILLDEKGKKLHFGWFFRIPSEKNEQRHKTTHFYNWRTLWF